MERVRYLIATMIFFAMFFINIVRTDFSVFIIAMVDKRNSTLPAPDYGPRFIWTEKTQARVLAAFYYGYVITTLIGGLLAENFGARTVVFGAILFCGMFTMLTPSFAGPIYRHVWGLRFLTGLAAGTVLPACNTLISKWAPTDEKGIFIATLIGGALGTVLVRPILSVIIISVAWVWAFSLEGFICMIFALVWLGFVRNEPKEHWLIKQKEIDYIKDSLGKTVTTSRKCPPYIKMAQSIPLLALIVLHFGNVWGYTFILYYSPKFLNQVLKYDLQKGSFVGSLPILARVIVGFIVGAMVDVFKRKEVAKATRIRKIFCLLSHVIPGILLCLIGILAFHPIITITLMTLALGLNGAAVATNLHNSQDLAPNYAGSIMSIIEGFANLSCFIAPEVAAYFHKNTDEIRLQWIFLFIFAAAVYEITATIFLTMGSAKIQSWNYTEKEANEDEEIKSELRSNKSSTSMGNPNEEPKVK